MGKRRYWLTGLFCMALCLCVAFGGALAEGDDATEEGTDGVSYAQEAPAPQIKAVEGKLEAASAANAAQLLRSGGESEAYRYWETAWGHVPKVYRMKKAAVAMLKNAVGRTEDAAPVGRVGIQFQPCYEVPLPAQGEKLQRALDFNIHGSIYTDSPLTNVTAAFTNKSSSGDSATATVTFDPAANVTSYSLVSKSEPIEGKSLDALMDASKLKKGTYTFTITAATSGQSSPTTLYTAEVTVEEPDAFHLTQNKFDDNYSEALAFFQGDTTQFLFNYWLRGADRDISTATEWRDRCLVDSPFGGRCHIKALPYFQKAKEYTENTYIKVDVLHRNGTVREGKVMLLKTIMDNDASPYVPRFQSNMEYVSHHCLGTAIDVNETLYPNLNIITNHELIGDDVRDHLTYNGIQTDEDGQQYYSFYYDGEYTSLYKRVPKTIVNYLLYELAFYRAGFQWGFYYETACDAMHFMLSENDPAKHMDSDVGLRKVYTYIDDGVEEVIAPPPADPTPEPDQAQVPNTGEE